MGDYELHRAVRAGKLGKVVQLVDIQHKSLQQKDTWGHSPLYYACCLGDKSITSFILKRLQEKEIGKAQTNFPTPKQKKKPALISEHLEDIILTRGDNEDEGIDNGNDDNIKNETECANSQQPFEIEILISMFPDHPISIFEEILNANERNLQKAIDILLLENPSTPTTSSDETQDLIKFTNTDLWPTLTSKPEKKHPIKKKTPPIETVKQDQNQNQNVKYTNEIIEAEENSEPLYDQWIDIDEDDDDEEESFDFESIHEGSQNSSIIFVEPDEWDIVSQTSQISFQSDLFEENEPENPKLWIVQDEKKASYVEALKINMIKKNISKTPQLYPLYDKPLPNSNTNHYDPLPDEALKLQEQIYLLKDRPYGKATKEMKGGKQFKEPKVKQKKSQ